MKTGTSKVDKELAQIRQRLEDAGPDEAETWMYETAERLQEKLDTANKKIAKLEKAAAGAKSPAVSSEVARQRLEESLEAQEDKWYEAISALFDEYIEGGVNSIPSTGNTLEDVTKGLRRAFESLIDQADEESDKYVEARNELEEARAAVKALREERDTALSAVESLREITPERSAAARERLVVKGLITKEQALDSEALLRERDEARMVAVALQMAAVAAYDEVTPKPLHSDAPTLADSVKMARQAYNLRRSAFMQKLAQPPEVFAQQVQQKHYLEVATAIENAGWQQEYCFQTQMLVAFGRWIRDLVQRMYARKE